MFICPFPSHLTSCNASISVWVFVISSSCSCSFPGFSRVGGLKWLQWIRRCRNPQLTEVRKVRLSGSVRQWPNTSYRRRNRKRSTKFFKLGISKITAWSNSNTISFNEEKNKVMLMSTRKRKDVKQIKICRHNKLLEQVTTMSGSQVRSGRAESLVSTRIRSQTVHPVVSCYSNWASQPTWIKYTVHNCYVLFTRSLLPVSRNVCSFPFISC